MLHLRVRTLIDGLADHSISDAGACISGDRLSYVGPRSDIENRVEFGAVIDPSNCVFMPGLSDRVTPI